MNRTILHVIFSDGTQADAALNYLGRTQSNHSRDIVLPIEILVQYSTRHCLQHVSGRLETHNSTRRSGMHRVEARATSQTRSLLRQQVSTANESRHHIQNSRIL